MTKQAMGEFIADLAEGGFVTLTPDPADRRAKLVSLTPAGREAARWARTTVARVERLWEQRIGTDEVATLKRLLAEVSGV
jgi:DNA-binding MarR family transcriptional regulator